MGGKADIVPVDHVQTLIHVSVLRACLLSESCAEGMEGQKQTASSETGVSRSMNWSQIVTSSRKHRGKKYRPIAFTEQGVAMLSSVLRSPRAVKVNIEIMRAFVRMRRLIAANAELAQRVAELEKTCDKQFKVVFDALRMLIAPAKEPAQETRREIGYHTLREGGGPARVARRRGSRTPVRY